MKNSFFSSLTEDEKEIVQYGLVQGTVLFCGVVVAAIMGVILRILLKAIVFLISAYFLRIYAGGYHAKTPLRCGILSAVTTILCFLWLKFFTIPAIAMLLILVAAGLIIVLYAPVENENRVLSDEEKSLYAMKTRLIVLAEVFICTVSYLFGWESVYSSIFVGICFICLSVMLGMFSRRNGRKRSEDTIV